MDSNIFEVFEELEDSIEQDDITLSEMGKFSVLNNIFRKDNAEIEVRIEKNYILKREGDNSHILKLKKYAYENSFQQKELKKVLTEIFSRMSELDETSKSFENIIRLLKCLWLKKNVATLRELFYNFFESQAHENHFHVNMDVRDNMDFDSFIYILEKIVEPFASDSRKKILFDTLIFNSNPQDIMFLKRLLFKSKLLQYIVSGKRCCRQIKIILNKYFIEKGHKRNEFAYTLENYQYMRKEFHIHPRYFFANIIRSDVKYFVKSPISLEVRDFRINKDNFDKEKLLELDFDETDL